MAKSIKQRDINLLLAMTQVNKDPNAGKGKRIVVLCIILFVVIVAGVTALIMSELIQLRDDKANLNLYLEDPNVIAQYNESLATESQANSLTSQANQLSDVLLAISSMPNMVSDEIRTVMAYSKSRVTFDDFNFDRTTGILSFTASGSAPSVIPIFVANLRASGTFEDVQYMGYSGTTPTSTGFTTDPLTGEQVANPVEAAKFIFSVTCQIKAPEPKIPTVPAARPNADSSDD